MTLSTVSRPFKQGSLARQESLQWVISQWRIILLAMGLIPLAPISSLLGQPDNRIEFLRMGAKNSESLIEDVSGVGTVENINSKRFEELFSKVQARIVKERGAAAATKDEPLPLKVEWARKGRSLMEKIVYRDWVQGVRAPIPNPFTVRVYDGEKTIQAGTPRDAWRPNASVTMGLFVLEWPLPEYVYYWIYGQKLSEVLAQKDAFIVGEEKINGHQVYIVEVILEERYFYSRSKLRIWIVPERGFLPCKIVRWNASDGTILECWEDVDLRLVNGVWYPCAVTLKLYMKDPDPKRSPYAFRTMKLTATNVRINAGIRDEDMAVKMPEGSIIVDTIAGKTFRVGGDAMFDRDPQKILKDLDSKESRRRLCDRGLGGTCACMTRTSSLGSLNSQDASVFWGSFYL